MALSATQSTVILPCLLKILLALNPQIMPPQRQEWHLQTVFWPSCVHILFFFRWLLIPHHSKQKKMLRLSRSVLALLRRLWSEERPSESPNTFFFSNCSLVGGEVWFCCLAENAAKERGILVRLRRYSQVLFLCLPNFSSLEAFPHKACWKHFYFPSTTWTPSKEK